MSGPFSLGPSSTCSSWLNLVKSFFTKLPKTLLRGMRVESKEELKQRIEQYIDRFNQDPVAFKWSYEMGECSVAWPLSC